MKLATLADDLKSCENMKIKGKILFIAAAITTCRNSVRKLWNSLENAIFTHTNKNFLFHNLDCLINDKPKK
jgi:hypothetical protein